VRITRPFYLGACEVTVGQFRQFVDTARYKSDAEREPGSARGIDSSTGKGMVNSEATWRDPGFPQSDDHPVVTLSWNDAVAFNRWLSEREGATYRLPTEAEWEYACRAGTTSRYWFGDDPEMLSDVANFADATGKEALSEWDIIISASDGYVFTAPVGSLRPSPFGLYDMHGNAYEYCTDWRDEGGYYQSSPLEDPQRPAQGRARAPRGGGWNVGPGPMRSASRMTAKLGTWSGFRVVCEIEADPQPAAVVEAEPTELLVNGDFRDWTDGVPNGWKTEIGAWRERDGPRSEIIQLEDPGLALRGDAATLIWRAVSQEVPLRKGRAYRLEFEARSEDIRLEGKQFDNCYVGFLSYDADGDLLDPRGERLSNVTQWEARSVDFTVPANAVMSKVMIFLSQTGTLKVRNLTLREIAPPAVRPDPKPQPDAPTTSIPPGWISLFDGKSLSGWRPVGSPGAWSVENGAIVGRDGQSLLVTKKEYGAFLLQMDVKILGDSGVVFPPAAKPVSPGGKSRLRGYEVSIVSRFSGEAKSGFTGSVFHHGPDSIKRLQKVTSNPVRDNRWFHLHLRVDGDRVTVSIDDQVLSSARLSEERRQRGHIALQAWKTRTEASFRNVWIKPL